MNKSDTVWYGPVVLILLVVGLFTFLFQSVIYVFLALFAGVLLGVLLDAFAKYMKKATSISRTFSIPLLIAGVFVVLTLVFWSGSQRIIAEVRVLAQRIPESLKVLEKFVKQHGIAAKIPPYLPDQKQLIPISQGIMGRIATFFYTSVGMVVNLAFILFTGFYLALDPQTYIGGLLQLVPPQYKNLGTEVIADLGRALRWWLVGRFSSMFAVGFLTGLGLWVLGIPGAMTLGILTGLLCFIPYIGPYLSGIPIILVALVEGPYLAFLVFLLLFCIQELENNFITPLIQFQAVSLPPVVSLTAQLLMAGIFGIFGLFVATPLTISLIVIVQKLYIQEVLGKNIELLGAHPELKE